jgi:Subtilase family
MIALVPLVVSNPAHARKWYKPSVKPAVVATPPKPPAPTKPTTTPTTNNKTTNNKTTTQTKPVVPATKPKPTLPSVALPPPPVIPAAPPRPAATTAYQAPAPVKAPEPASSSRASADQPMRVGVLQRDDDPESLPVVRSAADKAIPRPVISARPPTIPLGANVPPRPNVYRRDQIITGKPTAALRARAAQFGLDVEEVPKLGLGRIVLPPKREAWETLRGLQEEFPQQGFALNYVYEQFQANPRYDVILRNTAIEGVVPAGSFGGCDTERCYGRRVVGWQSHLAACARGVKVGVVDTGFDASHPAFAKRAAPLAVVMSPENAADRAPNWHGTGVLSLLAGAPQSSTPGLIPEADFLVADAFFPGPKGRPQTDTMRLLEALQRLHEHGAQIINLSLVGPYDELLHDRITYLAKRKGVVLVAAAGNGGPEAPPGYPAAYPEVIAVTAVDSNAKGWGDANRGNYIDVSAPGVKIWTALPDNKEGALSGTSFAAPFVTAIAAVTYNSSPLKGQIAARHQTLDPKGAMLGTFNLAKAEDSDSRTYGQGLIKAPPSCTPVEPPAQPWAATVLPRLLEPLSWLTDVRPAGMQ